jgi:hypothetical protein
MKKIFAFAVCLLWIASSSLLRADEPCDTDWCSTGCDSAPSFFSGNGCSKGLYFGAEATYLAPVYDESLATFTLTQCGVAQASLQSDFGTAEELTGAPRLVFGYAGDHGIGIQARYWELTSSASQNDVPDAIVGSQIQSLGGEDRFNAYTIDLELTKAFCHHGCNMLGTFGVRHGSIDHQRDEQVFGAVDLGSSQFDVFSMGAQTGEEFHGTGLTFSLSGLKSIKPCRGLAFYTSARGSTLWGSAETLAVTYSTFTGPLGGADSVNGAIDSNDVTMFIGEIGAGLQWSRCANSYSGRMFARAGVEYQYWGTSDGFALAQSTSGTGGLSNGTATAIGGSQETHLIGLALMAGYAW